MRIAILFLALLSFSESKAVVSLVGGVVGDHLIGKAGDELRNTVEHARAAAESLLGVADEMAKQRLKQIDDILQNTLIDIDEITQSAIKEATASINNLRKDIYADIVSVLREAECAANRTLIDTLRIAMGGMGEVLSTHEIRLSPAIRVRPKPRFCFWWCKDPYVVDVKSPFSETYKEVRMLMEEPLAGEHIKGNMPADYILGTYEFLSTFALKTACLYPTNESRWIEEYIEYKQLADEWKTVLEVGI